MARKVRNDSGDTSIKSHPPRFKLVREVKDDISDISLSCSHLDTSKLTKEVRVDRVQACQGREG